LRLPPLDANKEKERKPSQNNKQCPFHICLVIKDKIMYSITQSIMRKQYQNA